MAGVVATLLASCEMTESTSGFPFMPPVDSALFGNASHEVLTRDSWSSLAALTSKTGPINQYRYEGRHLGTFLLDTRHVQDCILPCT